MQQSEEMKVSAMRRAMQARIPSEIPYLVSPVPRADAPYVIIQQMLLPPPSDVVGVYLAKTNGKNLSIVKLEEFWAEYSLGHSSNSRLEILLKADLLVQHLNHIYALERGLIKFERRLFYKKTPEQKQELIRASLRSVVAPKTGGECGQ